MDEVWFFVFDMKLFLFFVFQKTILFFKKPYVFSYHNFFFLFFLRKQVWNSNSQNTDSNTDLNSMSRPHLGLLPTNLNTGCHAMQVSLWLNWNLPIARCCTRIASIEESIWKYSKRIADWKTVKKYNKIRSRAPEKLENRDLVRKIQEYTGAGGRGLELRRMQKHAEHFWKRC